MHIFRFAEESGEIVLKADTFDQLKPGLSLHDTPPLATSEAASLSLLPCRQPRARLPLFGGVGGDGAQGGHLRPAQAGS